MTYCMKAYVLNVTTITNVKSSLPPMDCGKKSGSNANYSEHVSIGWTVTGSVQHLYYSVLHRAVYSLLVNSLRQFSSD